MPDPGRELLILHLAFQTGKLEVSVGIDETGNEDGVGKLLCRHTRRPRDCCIGTNGRDSAVGLNQNGTTLLRGGVDRQQPAGREPAGWTVSADWASGRFLP